jgi:hypothetical protein
MMHLLSKPAAPDVAPTSTSVSHTQGTSAPVLITEQEVVFNTAAATFDPPVRIPPRWRGTKLVAAIGRIHLALPEPPQYLHREPIYFEDARMSRQMDHL